MKIKENKRFNINKLFILATTTITLFFGISVFNQAAASSSGATYYKGKSLIIVVPYGPEGHFDRFARLLAHYIPKYLPVKSVDVVNRPGGGSIVGTTSRISR